MLLCCYPKPLSSLSDKANVLLTSKVIPLRSEASLPQTPCVRLGTACRNRLIGDVSDIVYLGRKEGEMKERGGGEKRAGKGKGSQGRRMGLPQP